MKSFIWCLLALVPLSLCAQKQPEIRFETFQNRQDITAKAQATQKYVLVACLHPKENITDLPNWDVLKNEAVYFFFNAHYSDLVFQADSTATQHFISDVIGTYRFKAYPLLLFFDPTGALVDVRYGFVDAATLLAYGKSAMDTAHQYWKLRERFLNGEHSKALALEIMPAAIDHDDSQTAYADHDLFWDSVNDRYQKNNLALILRSFSKSTDKGFKALQQDPTKADRILEGQNLIKAMVTRVLTSEMYLRHIKGKSQVDWKQINKDLQSMAPVFATELLATLKVNEASWNKRWDDFARCQLDYYDRYFPQMTHDERWWMNNTLYNQIFQNCTDKKILKRAAVWSKVTITMYDPGKEDFQTTDTYANLLYKGGETSAAIAAEVHAIELANIAKDEEEKKAFEETLAKMKQGVPTWKIKKKETK